MRPLILSLLTLVVLLCQPPSLAWGAEKTPGQLEGVDIQPTLGAQLPLEETFIDESGKEVKLSSFFQSGKPVVFILNYYSCPMLCGLLLNGARDGFQEIDWKPGDHYKIVTISIDPKETGDLAQAKKESVLGSLASPVLKEKANEHWHFLVGQNGSEARLAKALGFGYRWVEEEKQYAHSAAIFIASPDGILTRVLYGIQFVAKDLKLALLEAGQGKVGTLAEKLLLFCYHYDPKDNKYALLASRLVSVAAAIMVLVILIAYGILYLRSRQKG